MMCTLRMNRLFVNSRFITINFIFLNKILFEPHRRILSDDPMDE
jgi:hypothetical protein